MGIISDSVLQHGGSVIAVVPDAMLRAGGEGEQHSTWGPIGHDELEEKGREKVESVSHIPCLFCSVNLNILIIFGLAGLRLS
jgi:hypothetical protein